jgi:hypothetical protein
MFHRHIWEIRGVRNFRVTYVNLGGDEPKTEILRVCTVCGKPKTKEITGTWTLEQLRA